MPKKLSDHSKSVRQQMIYNILRHHTSEENALSVSEIHNRLIKEDVETCHRTIKRDLEEMSSSHKFLSTENMPVRFYCSDDYEPDYQLTFNESELTTMALALHSLMEMADPFQRKLCERTEAILSSKLPKEIAIDFEKLKSLTIVSPGIRAVAGIESSEGYKHVLKALKEEKVLQCENHSPYKDEEYRKRIRTFSPLKLNMVGSEHYLFAYDHEDQKIKRLKICRLRNIRILDQKISKSHFNNLSDVEASIGGFGGPGEKVIKYVVECDDLMATLFEEKMIHPTQKVLRKNGKCKITFEANPSIEISRYLSGWSKHIQNVEPQEVMDEMKEIWSAGLKVA